MEKCSDTVVDPLSFLAASEKELLLQKMEKLCLNAGETLFEVGEEATGAFFVVSGQLAVKTYTGFDEKMQVVALLSGGSVVGELGLLTGERRSATLVAVENSQMYVLTNSIYEELKSASSELAVKVLEHCLKVSGIRLSACTKRLAHIL